MSSINDALKRIRQMDGSSTPVFPSLPQELPVSKPRSKAPLVLGVLIIIVLAGALVWYVLDSQVNSEIIARVEPVRRKPVKASKAPSTTPERTAPKPAASPARAVSAGTLSAGTVEVKPAQIKIVEKAAGKQEPAAVKPARPVKQPPVSDVKIKAAAKQPVRARTVQPAAVVKRPEPKNAAPPDKTRTKTQTLVSDYQRAIKLNPSNALAHLKLGNVFFFEMNDLNRALGMYLKVIKIDPDNKFGHNNLGVIFLKQNLFDRAEAEFDLALKIDPA